MNSMEVFLYFMGAVQKRDGGKSYRNSSTMKDKVSFPALMV